jgi:hypothetical protein
MADAQATANRRAGINLTPEQLKYFDQLEEKRTKIQNRLDLVLKNIFNLKSAARIQELTLEEKAELEKLTNEKEKLTGEIDANYKLMKEVRG